MSIITLAGHFPRPSGAPKPKFKVGDRVRAEWECDDRLNEEFYGKPIRVDGYVTGAVCSEFNQKPEWVYSVLVEKSNYGDRPHQAIEFGESDLNLRRSARTGVNWCETVRVSQNTRGIRRRGGVNR